MRLGGPVGVGRPFAIDEDGPPVRAQWTDVQFLDGETDDRLDRYVTGRDVHSVGDFHPTGVALDVEVRPRHQPGQRMPLKSDQLVATAVAELVEVAGRPNGPRAGIVAAFGEPMSVEQRKFEIVLSGKWRPTVGKGPEGERGRIEPSLDDDRWGDAGNGTPERCQRPIPSLLLAPIRHEQRAWPSR